MREFEHGGGVESFAKSVGCEVKEVIDLSSNINFVKPDIEIDFNTLDISAYPTYDSLYEKISKNYGVDSDEMELFNGGSSAIFTLFRFLNLKSCYIYSPAYLEYKRAAKKFAYELNLIDRFDSLEYKGDENSLVIFVNPSTPDGLYYNLEELLESWIKKGSTILVDESFLDFCEKESITKYIKSYDKLYILKSMTKFYSSAGIRVGTLLSNRKNIESLRELEPMWKLSQFDSNYLQEALKDESFPKKANEVNRAAKLFLEESLSKCSFIEKIFHSDANFVLIKLKDMDAKEFALFLKDYKIMVRDCSNFDFLDSSYVRVAVKSKEQLEVFKSALEILDVNKK